MRKLYILGIITSFLGILSTDIQAQEIENADEKWFNFQPSNITEPGVVGMGDWLDAPAGQHGFVTIENSGYVFEDGTPVKFWGTNHSNTQAAPEKAEAEKRAAWYAKMGVNAIRFHKFTYPWAMGKETNSTELKPELWDKMDYYSDQLRQKGIYYGWSPVFKHHLVDADSDRVLAYDELKAHANQQIIYLVNFAPDLQQVMFDLATHLLEHKNPYTGLKYADDPALIFYELQNEDNIFWLNPKLLEGLPTYKKVFCQQFSEWLSKKYGSHEKLLAAWGKDGLNMFPEFMKDEHLDKGNIYPSAWFPNFSPEAIENSASTRRMLDNAAFLYETQRDYYLKFIDVIRATGYKGPLVGSCWQAGQGVIHYYNLYTDYLVGIIDRHNYFGARPHRLEPGPFPNQSMMDFAGSGLFSSGLHAVKGRPFVLSEWTGKMPNEWIAEGPAIIGVYGMGFQGWDGSFHFNSAGSGFSDSMQQPNVYNTNNIIQIGQFPALARLIHRGDVLEGALLPNRKVHIPSLEEGKIGFEEKLRQNGDIKQLGGDVPIEALALGRLELEFTDSFEETDLPDFSRWLADSIVTSNTGQLTWNYRGAHGYFTADTEGTKAVAGFTKGQQFNLSGINIRTDNPFAIIYVTSTEPDQNIAQSNSLLITTLARARNTGMAYEYNGKETSLERVGKEPLKVEPVKVELEFELGNFKKVNVLDHDGLRTGKSLPIENSKVVLDGKEHQAIWYEVVK